MRTCCVYLPKSVRIRFGFWLGLFVWVPPHVSSHSTTVIRSCVEPTTKATYMFNLLRFNDVFGIILGRRWVRRHARNSHPWFCQARHRHHPHRMHSRTSFHDAFIIIFTIATFLSRIAFAEGSFWRPHAEWPQSPQIALQLSNF